jgi:hypothetical protein
MEARPAQPLRQIADALLEEYDVGEERCMQDLLALASRLAENKLIEIST